MGAAYSPDLRKRVVAAIKGGMSRNQASRSVAPGGSLHDRRAPPGLEG